MTGVPLQHWRSYGTDPLPTANAETFDLDQCGLLLNTVVLAPKGAARNAGHVRGRDGRDLNSGHELRLSAIGSSGMASGCGMRHDGCGGRAGRVELLTGIDGVSSRPVRKIVLWEG
jgi:hypothetical protein